MTTEKPWHPHWFAAIGDDIEYHLIECPLGGAHFMEPVTDTGYPKRCIRCEIEVDACDWWLWSTWNRYAAC